MEVIRNLDDLTRNISYLASALESPDHATADYAKGLVKRGICFVVTERDGKPFFSPSRFIGYRENSRTLHESNDSRHGGVTNLAISSVLRAKPSPSASVEVEYAQFCAHFGIISQGAGRFGVTRKFWDER